jgi:Rieske Fe-S protein
MLSFSPVRLITAESGKPFTLADIEPATDYVFFYPFRSTPCLLVDLGVPTARDVELETEEGMRYQWPGGIGPNRSVVAYSAICAHRMAHPTKSVSFIGYRPDVDRFMDQDKQVQERSRVIHCCSENSVYDPADGCRVLAGPAPQPLAAVSLEVDQDGALVATGTVGPTQFERFFDTYAPRLELEFGLGEPQRPVDDVAEVLALSDYTQYRVRC